MPQYQWSPPQHPDPAEDQPEGIDGVEWSDAVDHAPVWVDVVFSRTGPQHLPGFVDADAGDRVYVQFVHMGFAHRLWVPRSSVTTRRLKPRR
ncbi:hypothetical protein DEJ17_06550 [Curtobacterium sp. MCSS17_011]|nr:hypothetical protein DEJ17_06550 [Curtobacterium sp. MCSS17_011]